MRRPLSLAKLLKKAVMLVNARVQLDDEESDEETDNAQTVQAMHDAATAHNLDQQEQCAGPPPLSNLADSNLLEELETAPSLIDHINYT
jgi:hypothetical protein